MPVKPRQPAPALEVQLLDGSTWRLKDAKPKNFEMIVFYRGLHCPICKTYLSDLEAKLPEFAKRGVDVIAVSTDTGERAGKAKAEWNLTNLRVGCELPPSAARDWGLFVSRAIRDGEPPEFNEPGLFLVKPDGTLFFASRGSAPWARPPLDQLLRGSMSPWSARCPPAAKHEARQLRQLHLNVNHPPNLGRTSWTSEHDPRGGLAPLPPEHAPELKEQFEAARKRMGFIPNSVLIMQRKPKMVQAFTQMSAAIWDPSGSVDLKLKRLISHVASRSAGCKYCMAHTAEGAHKLGVDEQKLAAVWNYQTSPLFTPAERAALDVAVAAGTVPNAVTDEMFMELRKHWSDEQVVEIVGVIAMFGFLNRWNDTMATPLEDEPLEFGERHLAAHGWDAGKHLR